MSIRLMLATVGMISSFSRKSGPSTPAIVNWFLLSPDPSTTPFIVMLRPMTFGSELNTRLQKP